MKTYEVLKVNRANANYAVDEFLLFMGFSLKAFVSELPLARWQRQKER